MLDNQQQLDNAIICVNEIDTLATELFEMNKNAFEGNKELSKGFSNFFQVLNETKEKLASPVLSVAMVGTTSAGKSTIVNALSGRNVAPMEKKETSAGVLKLLYSEKRSVNITKTKGSRWQSGTIQNVSDDEIRTIIAGVFDKYKRFIKIAAAPEISVYGPLQWQTNRNLLDLPDNLSVEFVDLPGLKTLTDEKNLQVIQSALEKSLCVIAMDFNDVDDSRIQRLLEELKDIVKAMSGKTDSLLFLLNKIDDVKSTDVPVDIVINGGEHNGIKVKGLKKVISEGLSLPKKTNVKIIPFVGLLLYHAELALIKDSKGNVVGYDKEKISNLFEDCEGIFGKNKKNFTEEERRTYRRVQNAVEDGDDIPIEVLTKFGELCYRLSHASDFYCELKERICDSFSDIIIRPALIELDANLRKLVADVSSYININKKTSKLELFSERLGVLKMKLFLLGANSSDTQSNLCDELSEIENGLSSIEITDDEEALFVYNRILRDVRKLQESIEQHPLGYIDGQIKDINESITDITTNLIGLHGDDNVNKYLNDIKDKNRSVNVFNGISSIPENIKKRLIAEAITPFRKSIEEKKSKGEFIQLASKSMPVVLAEDLGGQYSNLFNLFYITFDSFTNGELYWEKKSSSEFSDEWENDVKGVYHWVDVRMRDVLSKKTNIYFQLETNTFINVLRKYLKSELSQILKELKKKLKVDETDLSVLIDNLMNVKQKEIIMPETLFQFSTPSGIEGKEGLESRSVFSHYETHSCSSDEAVYKTVYDKYYMYKYENSKSIYLRWESGIDNSFAPFWTIITTWIKESVQSYMENIRESALQVAEMTTSFLNDKMNAVNSNNEINMEIFDKIGDKVDKMSQIKVL